MTHRIYWNLVLAGCLTLTGCAGITNNMRPSTKISQWNPLKRMASETKAEQDSQKTAQTMAVIWKDSILEKPGVTPVRGFGGRLFFYDEDSNAVKADGELIVYGFDDSKERAAGDSKPDRKFIFQSDRFQSHYSETDLGASYSVWIPWEKVGGVRKSITLIPIFKMADGTILKSGQSINVLPGKMPETSSTTSTTVVRPGFAADSSTVRQVGFVESASGSKPASNVVPASFTELAPDGKNNRIRTSTIQLTPNLANRLGQATAAKAKPVVSESENSTHTNVLQARYSANDNQNQTTDKQAQSPELHQPKSRAVFGSPGSFN